MSTPRRPEHQEGTITTTEMISPTVAHLTIKAQQGLPAHKAGQFCWITREEGEERYRRPYSIATAPWEEELGLCIKRVPEGRVSGKLVELATGDKVDVFSPLGIFTLPDDEHPLILIATGTGIAPFRGMIRHLFRKHYSGQGTDTEKDVTLLFGTRTEEEAIYREELEALAQAKENFTYHLTLTREEAPGAKAGRVQQHLDDVLKGQDEPHVYICGLKNMVRTVDEECRRKGVPAHRIHKEIY